MAPGPELGMLLGGLNISALTGIDLVEVLRARARQLSHEQAQLLATMVEIGLCDPHAGPDEVARLVHASEFAADEIRAALAWTRNAAYREYHFAEVLLTRLPAVFCALDAGAICRRDRAVIGYLDEDGTATVTGRKLPADQAAAACARIEDLARAAKRAGHPGRVGPLRADIYVGLLEGRWQHLARNQIIADLLAQATADDIPQDSTPWPPIRTPPAMS